MWWLLNFYGFFSRILPNSINIIMVGDSGRWWNVLQLRVYCCNNLNNIYLWFFIAKFNWTPWDVHYLQMYCKLNKYWTHFDRFQIQYRPLRFTIMHKPIASVLHHSNIIFLLDDELHDICNVTLSTDVTVYMIYF